MSNIISEHWWSEEYGYFGPFYLKADTLRDEDDSNSKNISIRTKKEVNGLLKRLSLPKGSKIFDCPCGYGRHSIELAQRGFCVVGADINSVHLSKAVHEAKQLPVKFVKKNMLNLHYTSEFDAVINMFASFGFFNSDEDNEKVLINFYNALRPCGKLLIHIDINVSKIIRKNNKHLNRIKLKNGEILNIEDYYDPEKKRINGVWTIQDRNNNKITRKYSVRIYLPEEFNNLLNNAGFSNIRFFSNWKGSSYTEDSNDMIIVAKK